jgi:hypothetical protein
MPFWPVCRALATSAGPATRAALVSAWVSCDELGSALVLSRVPGRDKLAKDEAQLVA